MVADNPWFVDSIHVFWHLKCPECTFDSKEEDIFQVHAIENHPLSYTLFSSETSEEPENNEKPLVDNIKTENLDQDYYEGYSIPDMKKDHQETNFNEEGHEENTNIVPSNFPEIKEEYSEINSNDTVHEGKNDFSCDLCDSQFAQKRNLSRHVKAVHEKVMPFCCSICNKAFASKQILVRHFASQHKDQDFPSELTNLLKSKKRKLSDQELYYSDQELSNQDENVPLEVNILTDEIDSIHEEKKPKIKKRARATPKEWKCSICGESLSSIKDLRSHFNTVHEGKQKCAICTESLPSIAELKNHYKKVHEGEKPYSCSICGKGFFSDHAVKGHIKCVHEKSKPFKCSLCTSSFFKRNGLNVHMETVHEGRKPFLCSLCDMSFSQGGGLKSHISTVHEKKKPFKCSVCDYRASQKSSVGTHFERVHERKKEYECSICNSKFYESKDLERHFECVHEGKRPFQCSECGSAFAKNQTLRAHIMSVHEKIFPEKEKNTSAPTSNLCPICGVNLTCGLKAHIERVHEGKKPHTCKICGSNFARKPDLRGHIQSVHEKLKPFKCLQCDSSFFKSNGLKVHMETVHGGKRQFKCEFCDSEFSQKGGLRVHITSVHEKKKNENSMSKSAGHCNGQEMSFQCIKVEPSTVKESQPLETVDPLLIHEFKSENFEENEATPTQDLTLLCVKQEELCVSGSQNEQENEMIVIKEDLFWGE